LREQVINEVSPGKFYLRAGHIDEATNLMREVTIYDMSDPTRRRTIYADSGNMNLSKGLTDLELTLYDGNMEDVPTTNPDELQRLYFVTDLIRVRGVGNQFQKTTSDSYKSDREMTVCEMQEAQDRARKDHESAEKSFRGAIAELTATKTKLPAQMQNVKVDAPWDVGVGRLYCAALGWIAPKILPEKAHAQGVTVRRPPLRASTTVSSKPAASSTATTASSTGSTASPAFPPKPGQMIDATKLSQLEAVRIRLVDSAQLMNSYGVEIHKKFALAVACFVFVLLGAPIALRFPRGGVGLTIGVSLFVFALYYVCLIAGESIAKRGMMPAVVSMWMANVLFAIIALWMMTKMGKETSTARGGDAKEMIGAIKGWIRTKTGWKNRRVRREGLAT
jgi:lipopolysaccharide export system permease protein